MVTPSSKYKTVDHTCPCMKKTSKSAQASVTPVYVHIEGSIQKYEGTLKMHLKLLNNNGQKMVKGSTLKVEVGELITAEVTGPHLRLLSLRGYARDCFVTPTPDKTDKLRHNLLVDGLVNTFRLNYYLWIS